MYLIVVNILIFFISTYFFYFSFTLLETQELGLYEMGEGERRVQWLNEQDWNAECSTLLLLEITIKSVVGNRAGCSIHSHLLAWGGRNKCINNYRSQFIILIFVKMNVMTIDHLQRHRQLSLKISQNNHGQCKLPEINEQ